MTFPDRLDPLGEGSEVQWHADPASHGTVIGPADEIGAGWWRVRWDRLDGEPTDFIGFQPDGWLVRL